MALAKMHHIYHTSGFIFGSSSVGEANRVLRIFTKDLGFVKASAQGARHLKSKLRYHLRDFSLCELSLVRGREFWRVVGALKQADIFHDFREAPETSLVFGRVFSLLERLLKGEEKNEELFRYLEEAVLFVRKKNQPAPLMRNFEYILVLRILSNLGYLGASPDTSAFLESPYWSDDLLLKMGICIPKILGEINRSLKESQL